MYRAAVAAGFYTDWDGSDASTAETGWLARLTNGDDAAPRASRPMKRTVATRRARRCNEPVKTFVTTS